MEKKELTDILIARNNNYFRAITDPKNSLYLHDTQINAARKIVLQLGSNVLRTNHVMLIAKMQSGKTGVCNSVVNIINKSRLYRNMAIKKYMFITGMNDCGLKDQTYNRLKDQVMDANVDNIYTSRRSKRNLSHNRYFVLKNSDLMSYDGNLDNSLIFIDESHYGSNEKNILTQFLVKHDIDWKDTNSLIKRNIYIVSVSATPFDELVSDTENCKKIIELETSEEYVGVSEFLNNGLVENADKDDISKNGLIFDYIKEAHSRMIDNEENGSIIIRTRNFDVIKDNGYVKDNFNVFEMYSNGTNIEYEKLNSMMHDMVESNNNRKIYNTLGVKDDSKPLMILIKGAFRAGITISEEYKNIIYMIYDYSIKSDTTAQALLGRMCGYRSSTSKVSNTKFYINKKYATMYSLWENNFVDKDLIPCDTKKMEWISNGYKGDDVEIGSKSCGNFSIKLTDEEIIDLYERGKKKKSRVPMMEKMLPVILHNHNLSVVYDYIGECRLSGKNNYAKSSQEKRFNSFSKDSLVFQFRPEKIKKFISDTNRTVLTKDDLGKKCVSVVLDSEIYENEGKITLKGNKRLLVYYVEVGQKKMVYSRKNQYKPHKDTKLI